MKGWFWRFLDYFFLGRDAPAVNWGELILFGIYCVCCVVFIWMLIVVFDKNNPDHKYSFLGIKNIYKRVVNRKLHEPNRTEPT